MFKSTAARKFFNLFNFSLSPNFVNTWCCLKLFRSSAARKFVNFIQSAYLSSLCWLPIKVIISANCSISVISQFCQLIFCVEQSTIIVLIIWTFPQVCHNFMSYNFTADHMNLTNFLAAVILYICKLNKHFVCCCYSLKLTK